MSYLVDNSVKVLRNSDFFFLFFFFLPLSFIIIKDLSGLRIDRGLEIPGVFKCLGYYAYAGFCLEHYHLEVSKG